MKKLLLLLFLPCLLSLSCSPHDPLPMEERVVYNYTGVPFEVEIYDFFQGKMQKSYFQVGKINNGYNLIDKRISEAPGLGIFTGVDSMVLRFDDGKVLPIKCIWDRIQFDKPFWCYWNKSPINRMAYEVQQLRDRHIRTTFVFTDSLYFLAK